MSIAVRAHARPSVEEYVAAVCARLAPLPQRKSAAAVCPVCGAALVGQHATSVCRSPICVFRVVSADSD